jgi:hypothetical protein
VPVICSGKRKSLLPYPNHMKRLFTLFPLIVGVLSLSAQQKYTVSGTVTEKGSKELLPGVNIYSPSAGYGTSTNTYGFYSLSLPADSVRIIVSMIGYQPMEFKLKLKENVRLDVELRLQTTQIGEAVIEAEKTRLIAEKTQMSSIEISAREIKEIPALLGEKDVLKVIQLLPGVQSGGEGQSGFYVRGGGPDQNLIILDDAVVYNANHLFGFFSIFNGDALKSAELIKGGFPARYGGRLSSVLDMQMKDGSKEKFGGEAGIGLIAARVMLEGPIQKGKSSWIVSGRRTYIDALVQPFLPAEEKGGYFFYDLNAKTNFTLDDRNRLFVSGYFGRDKFYFRAGSKDSGSRGNFLWGNSTATVRWNRIVNDKTFSNTSFILTNYKFNINFIEKFSVDEFSLDYRSGIRDLTLKHDIDYHPHHDHKVKVGAITTYHMFTPSAVVIKTEELNNFQIEREVDKIHCAESGIYAEDDWRISDKWKANGGLRISHFLANGKNYFGIEPRAAARYLIRPDLSAKASYATMNQYLHLLSNTGVGLPTDLWVPATDRVGPQRSHQIAAGFAKDLMEPELTISLEGYYKWMNNVIAYKEGASFLFLNDLGSNEPVRWEDNVTTGDGLSYGAEILVRKSSGDFTGWVGYTLSWTTLQFAELNNGNAFYPRYDRRHDISVVGMYKIRDGLSVSATWVYGTGQAITLPLATYPAIIHDPIYQGSLVGFPTAYFVNEYGEKNSFRMAPYHRMDAGIRWSTTKEKYERTLEFSVYNLYNRYNPFFYYIDNDYSGKPTLKQVTLFPIIPSLSYSAKF